MQQKRSPLHFVLSRCAMPLIRTLPTRPPPPPPPPPPRVPPTKMSGSPWTSAPLRTLRTLSDLGPDPRP
eukprot:2800991-Rhodomonas_salina.2